MLAAKFDKAAAENKRLADFSAALLHRIFKTRLSEEIMLCLVATATAGFAFSSGYGQTEMLYIPAFAVMCAAWLTAALLCGFRRKWGFGVFAAVFWLLPQLFIYRADSVQTMMEYDKGVDVIGRASSILVRDSLGAFRFGDTPEQTVLFAAVGVLIAAELVMVVGMLIREQVKNSDFYCDFRDGNPQYE